MKGQQYGDISQNVGTKPPLPVFISEGVNTHERRERTVNTYLRQVILVFF